MPGPPAVACADQQDDLLAGTASVTVAPLRTTAWFDHGFYDPQVGMIWVAYRRSPGEAAELVESTDSIESLLESADEETFVDLDKAWHGIHWLLTGSQDSTDDVTSEVIFGGKPVGEDLGYGPARLLDPERVRAVASTLRDLPADELRRRVDLKAMSVAELYPDIWDETDVIDEYLVPAYDRLCAFYADAAQEGQAIIQTIC